MTANRKSIYLTEWRQHLGFSLDDLAEKSGADAGHIEKVEYGHLQPGTAFVDACAKALGIDPAKLLSASPAR
jgi:transcriptional regulator with XRE-family HTH domain